MRRYEPPLPDDLPPDVRPVTDLMAPMWDEDLVAIAADEQRTQVFRERAAQYLHRDFEVELTFAAPGSPLRGADALIEAWRELLSVFESYRPHLSEVVDLEDGRIAVFSEDQISTAEGIHMTIPVGAIYDLEDGLVRRARFYPDHATARAEIA